MYENVLVVSTLAATLGGQAQGCPVSLSETIQHQRGFARIEPDESP